MFQTDAAGTTERAYRLYLFGDGYGNSATSCCIISIGGIRVFFGIKLLIGEKSLFIWH